MIREQELAVLAAQRFAEVISNVTDEQWDLAMPSDFKTLSAESQTLRSIVNYHAYDDAWIPDMLAGRTMAEVGDEKWKGDLLGDDPTASYLSYNQAAQSAIETLDDPSRTVHCSFGDFSAADYLLQVISFRALRSWDIARSLGLDTTLPDALVQGMWDVLVPHADEWREWGVYDPAVEVSADASSQDRMLGALGFEPQH